MWKAYDTLSCLRETAGLRGVAPSIRFNEPIPGLGSREVMHVPTSEDVYLWGVEMFSKGIDCVKITYITTGGSAEIIKDGGNYISAYKGKSYMAFSSASASISEKLPFEDFWEEPYLVNKNDEKIIKSNFFRSFNFSTPGYYKIELDETFNPDYLNPDFMPVDFSANSEYDVNTYNIGKSRDTTNESYVRSNTGLKKIIYIRAIPRSNDIVDGSAISRNLVDLPPGLVPTRNVGRVPYNDGSYRIEKIGPWHLRGNNSYYRIDGYNNQNFPSAEWTHSYYGRVAVIAPKYTLNDFWDNYLETSYRPYYIVHRQGCRYINMRNGIMENITFYGSEWLVGHQFLVMPNSYWYDYEDSIVSESERAAKGLPSGVNYQYPFQCVSYLNNQDSNGAHVLIDMRGAVFKNCTFDKHSCSSINERFVMLDGAVFENCKFIGLGLDYFRSGGLLIKNCSFEEMSTLNGVSLSFQCGSSCCIMGCTQKYTERGTLCTINGGQISDNIWIRHSLYGIDRFQNANEHWNCENIADVHNLPAAPYHAWDNNMWIMGRSAAGPAGFGSYSTGSKFNIVAFNSFDSSVGNGSFDLFKEEFHAGILNRDVHYHCFLYNDTIGLKVRIIRDIKNCRILNCIFRKPHWVNNPASGYTWTGNRVDDYQGSEFYGVDGGLLEILGRGIESPKGNLISECIMVDYFETSSSFYGTAANTDNPWQFSNINPKIDDSLLLSGKNVVYNLRKIIEDSANDSYAKFS